MRTRQASVKGQDLIDGLASQLKPGLLGKPQDD